MSLRIVCLEGFCIVVAGRCHDLFIEEVAFYFTILKVILLIKEAQFQVELFSKTG